MEPTQSVIHGPFPVKMEVRRRTPPPYANGGYGHTASYGVRRLATQLKPDTSVQSVKKVYCKRSEYTGIQKY